MAIRAIRGPCGIGVSVKLITNQEPQNLGAVIVQQGYKLSFIILYGHSRLDRPNEKLCWVYVRLPTHPPA